MVSRQQGSLAALSFGVNSVVTEVAKLPKALLLTRKRLASKKNFQHPGRFSIETVEAIASGLERNGAAVENLILDGNAFWAHTRLPDYPKNYAAGPVTEGGVREKKLMEYYVSLELLNVQPTDTVIDVASEWSIFPDVLRKLTGATVYQQDLIYPPGIHGYRIGGNAAEMTVPDGFANKLVLHNSFEHFEGDADTNFIFEAWRVLRPGGKVCIIPFYLSDQHSIITDPLLDRRSVVWDNDARIVEIPWCHHRFGRFYSADTAYRHVLVPAKQAGFEVRLYRILNVNDVLPKANIHFVLLLEKPAPDPE